MARYECHCGARYRLNDAHAGRRAKCRKCGDTFVIPGENEELRLRELAQEVGHPHATSAIPADRESAKAAPGPQSLHERLGRWRNTFVGDLLRILAFPSSLSELRAFLGISLLLALPYLGDILHLLFCFFVAFMPIFYLMAEGAFAAYSFSIIQQEANNEQELPSFPFCNPMDLSEVWRTQLWPLGAYTITMLIAALPVLVFVSFGLSGPVSAGVSGPDWAVILWLGMTGLFLWPLIVMLVAVGGFAALLKIGQAAAATILTFPAYLCVVALVYGGFWLTYFGESYEIESPAGAIGTALLVSLARVYTQIAAMRALGAYYNRNRERFAFL